MTTTKSPPLPQRFVQKCAPRHSCVILPCALRSYESNLHVCQTHIKLHGDTRNAFCDFPCSTHSRNAFIHIYILQQRARFSLLCQHRKVPMACIAHISILLDVGIWQRTRHDAVTAYVHLHKNVHANANRAELLYGELFFSWLDRQSDSCWNIVSQLRANTIAIKYHCRDGSITNA